MMTPAPKKIVGTGGNKSTEKVQVKYHRQQITQTQSYPKGVYFYYKFRLGITTGAR